MKSKKGFTLIELMVVILIVAILAAVAIPILRGRIDAAKWSEGKAMMGTIATAIRAYAVEIDAGDAGGLDQNGDPITMSPDMVALGFAAGDLTGSYFLDENFSATITQAQPLQFLISCEATTWTATPTGFTLNEQGQFIAQ